MAFDDNFPEIRGIFILKEHIEIDRDEAVQQGYTDGLNKINIDGIGDVYCGSTYEEVQVVDDVGSSFPAYSDSLFISGQEGLFAIMGRYEGSEKSPAEGVVEKFMQINRNVLSSLRPAETE